MADAAPAGMPVTIPQVQASQPANLVQAGAEIGQKAAALGTQIEQHQKGLQTLHAGWQGSASQAAQAKSTATVQRMQQLQEALTRTQTIMQEGGGQLAQTRSSLLQTVSGLTAQGWQVGPDGSVSVRPGSTLEKYAKLSPANAMQLQALAASNAVNVKTMLASFDTADRRLGQNLRGAVSALDSPMQNFGPGGIPAPQSPKDTGPQIPQGKDATEVKKWWEGLSKEDRERLLREQPEKLGNLNGIPVADRSTANKAVMDADIARVENATEALSQQEMTRYYNALKVREGLQHNEDSTDAPSYLYVYEPEAFNGQGRAAISIGDPDTADNTAVVVPGTSHSVSEGWLSSDDAANVYNETQRADPSKSNAVVAWMGYNAPDSLTDPQVGQVGNAREGGALLSSDVNALSVTNHGDSHVTVIGHSYGSTTVADAAAGYGMRVDDVVLIGSPGTDLAKSAADFHLPENGHVYVGAASTDPITHLGGDNNQVHIPGTGVTIGLGTDPADDDFGSTRFKAEVEGWTLPWKDHSGYLVPGSESLFSISDIASGHGDALEHDGMTADHRTQVLGVEIDPEAWRIATGGHRHQ